ncbi:Proteasome activator complex subunit 3 [Fasciola hepatica]|uniref:Proteasome activator complex subunit 3 n=1 Tax=Fasciola hepatica TaxID=6192 RepID=A0A4E0R7Y9_FASHE|nr:Proteasome activator complex subunit 3 [Fasciola hepatica]
MANEESRLREYKEKTKVDGEELVRNVFPKRVFEMEGILASELFSFVEPEKVYSEVNIPYPQVRPAKILNSSGDLHHTTAFDTEPPLPVEKFRNMNAIPSYGPVPYNRYIKAMIEKTKPCLTQLMMEAQLVRLWVQYNIPRIEDGNNFGVGIQEEVLSEASSIERDACTFLDQITRYFASRGKLVGKVAKFPHIDDYRECIRDMDEKQAITMRYIIMEIRNHYATLHDIILKNIDRIKMPRSNNAISMY